MIHHITWQTGLIILALSFPATGFVIYVICGATLKRASLRRYRPTIETRKPHANEFSTVMRDWK